MIEKASKNAEKYGYTNTEFILGDIENLPIDDNSIDIIISNCVINLAPNKDKVFAEASRVLKPTGKLFASDIVLLEELSEEQRSDAELISGCVGGALLKDDYLAKITGAGLKYEILHEDTEISKSQYNGINLESLKFAAYK
jgi:SAM-dependent methyltransferase